MDYPAARSPWELRSRCHDAPVVYDGVRPDLCPALRAAILARSGDDREPRPWLTPSRSTPSLNEGGWKSAEDLFSWPDAAVRDLADELRREYLSGAIGLTGWAMVNRLGSRHPRHHHGVSVLSGVYYVDPGEGSSAPTIFECADPEIGDVSVDPSPGRLALFPGDLWHRVPTYEGRTPRITIAFDVRR